MCSYAVRAKYTGLWRARCSGFPSRSIAAARSGASWVSLFTKRPTSRATQLRVEVEGSVSSLSDRCLSPPHLYVGPLVFVGLRDTRRARRVRVRGYPYHRQSIAPDAPSLHEREQLSRPFSMGEVRLSRPHGNSSWSSHATRLPTVVPPAPGRWNRLTRVMRPASMSLRTASVSRVWTSRRASTLRSRSVQVTVPPRRKVATSSSSDFGAPKGTISISSASQLAVCGSSWMATPEPDGSVTVPGPTDCFSPTICCIP